MSRRQRLALVRSIVPPEPTHTLVIRSVAFLFLLCDGAGAVWNALNGQV